jgi:hypothetical protein
LKSQERKKKQDRDTLWATEYKETFLTTAGGWNEENYWNYWVIWDVQAREINHIHSWKDIFNIIKV